MNAPGLWDTVREEAHGRALATPECWVLGGAGGQSPKWTRQGKTPSPESLMGKGPKKGEVGGPVLRAAGGLREYSG